MSGTSRRTSGLTGRGGALGALAGVLLAAVAVTACSDRATGPGGSGSPLVDLVDLVAEAPLADRHREIARLDFGTAEARSALAAGWSWNERTGDGEPFVWSDGDASELELFLTRARPLPLTLSVAAFSFPGAPPQSVRVRVNRRPATELEIGPHRATYRLELPAELLRAGANRLRFEYAWARSPAEVGSGRDRRRLAVAWHDLVAGRDVDAAERELLTDGEQGLLGLPWGAQLDVFARLPAGSALALDGIERRGDGELELLVAGPAAPPGAGAPDEAERGAHRAIGERRIPVSGSPRRIDLDVSTSGLYRISLRAVVPERPAAGPSSPPGARWSGVRLAAPRIVVPGLAAPRSGGDAASVGAAGGREPSSPSGAPPAGAAPPIIVYLVDTLRADHLGCYGYPRPVSPALDAFAADATLFAQAIAQSSWTKTAVASLFTGLPPTLHGLHGPEDGLAPEAVLLAEELAAAGYQTAGFVANAHLAPPSGFARGFERYDFLPEAPNDSGELNRRVVSWLDGIDRGRPFFLYVHTIDPHAPYTPPEAERRRLAAGVARPAVGSVASIRAIARGEIAVTDRLIADLVALYDAEIAANDRRFGELLDELRRRGLYEGSLIVFLSDHGEEFHEHGVFGHGWDLYREVLQVPLVVRWPGGRSAGRVAHPAQHLDLLPTLLAAAGRPPPPGLDGIDLALLAEARASGERPLFSHMDYEGRQGASVVTRDWHLIEPISPGFAPGRGSLLFDWRRDPAERHDIAAGRPIRAGALRREVRRRLAAVPEGQVAPEVELDPELRRQLDALGYLGRN